MPALDRYDQRDIDDEVLMEGFEEREAARLRAEDEMDRAQGRRRTRLPGALLEGACLYLAVLAHAACVFMHSLDGQVIPCARMWLLRTGSVCMHGCR